MHGKQYVSNLERKGPHKSMHCKFCKPPGVVTPEKPTRPQLETKTKIHLVHEAADLRLSQIHDEPGFPAVDSEACICILEGDKACPKCVPDKNRGPIKKKTCRCPKGAKPHPNMYNVVTPKKKKKKEENNEFWWEKYSREQDALTKETWAAYMAQRKKDKELQKCQKREEELLTVRKNNLPDWYQKLSCQQVIYVEFLSTAIRLDSDENITDRTYFILAGIGLYPRPKRKVIKKCLRFCHYNSIHFLNQLYLLTNEDDPFNEKNIPMSYFNGVLYSWNERLLMSAMCYLEFPALLRELMDRLPPLPQKKLPPQIPYPVFPKPPKKKYDNPYEEPIWQERLNWVEKMKIDRLNRSRAHMDLKRVKIPPLALKTRPSLIDARPPFLGQIEANERSLRRVATDKKKMCKRRHKISTFNSTVDVTAIAGIEASDVSITDKAETDEICVFLREPMKEPELVEDEVEEECLPEKVTFSEEVFTTQINRLRTFSDLGEISEEEHSAPFKTPPKTESGVTIEEPCVPPKSSPGPPSTHYNIGKRELDILNEELCRFHPYVTESTQTMQWSGEKKENLTSQLESVAQKLKVIAGDEQETQAISRKKKKKPKRRKSKKPKKCDKVSKRKKKSIKRKLTRRETKSGEQGHIEPKEDQKIDEVNNEEEVGEEEEFNIQSGYSVGTDKDKLSKKKSEISDPDPDYDEVWSARAPCTVDDQLEEKENKKKKRKRKRRRKITRRKLRRKKKYRKKQKKINMIELKEESGEYIKKRNPVVTADKETMTECFEGEYDFLYKAESPQERANETAEAQKGSVFRGALKPLLKNILKDLAEEGFISASYPDIQKHPDIIHLVLYLMGEVLDKKKRDLLLHKTKRIWNDMKELRKFPVPIMHMPTKKLGKLTWNDRQWISQLAKAKNDEFYFKIAKSRAEYSVDLYKSLFQSYFGTPRYLKIFSTYMTFKYEDAILRGII